MNDYLKAKDILEKGRKASEDFSYKSKLQVLKVDIKRTRSDRPYLEMTLGDITGKVYKFRKWCENDDDLKRNLKIFQIGNIIEFEGKFQNEYKSTVIKIARKLSDDEFEIEEFLPNINDKAEALIKELNDTISKIKNPFYKRLLESIFNDEDLKKRYIESPGAVSKHHAYKYGNLEHTIGMIKLAETMEDYYGKDTGLDMDLVYTGILIHDIGKILEYALVNGLPVMNPRYSMLNHHILGDEIIREKIKQIEGFPKDLENKLRHIIISHHGKKEWGAEIEPQFPEAQFIHYLDMIDSRYKLNLIQD
ncbi:MAG: HD domain-containing protein [Promethearchaeota archaeon]